MSETQIPEDMQKIVDIVLPYLEKHPFGKSGEDIHEEVQSELEEDVDRQKTQEVLDLLETNDDVMNINGKWRV